MDLSQIRRLIVTALFSDDELLDRLVLKGGNALELLYGIGNRASVDLDFSMSEDFVDVEDAEARIFRALRDRFEGAGFVLFDRSFERRPSPTIPVALDAARRTTSSCPERKRANERSPKPRPSSGPERMGGQLG